MAQPRSLSARLGAAAAAAAWVVTGAAALAGCASKTRPAPPSPPSPPAAAPEAPLAAPLVPPPGSYDWHPLVLAPFGTAFKDMPVVLAEVLVFHDPAESARAGDEGDCFRPKNAAPPVFLGRSAEDYLLCFERDRLKRIEASVQLPAAGAPALFAAACSDWQRRAVPGIATSDRCEGRDADVDFSARLAQGPQPAAALVSIALVRAESR
ncbi:MAG TPA: hypothetical protein VME42_20885 [Steroidobacteraceae bacterium]|nr:hypothetical protein [Steroidobacteraceae bacterium]